MSTFLKKQNQTKKIPYTIYILQRYKHIKCRNDITLKDGAIYRSYKYCIARWWSLPLGWLINSKEGQVAPVLLGGGRGIFKEVKLSIHLDRQGDFQGKTSPCRHCLQFPNSTPQFSFQAWHGSPFRSHAPWAPERNHLDPQLGLKVRPGWTKPLVVVSWDQISRLNANSTWPPRKGLPKRELHMESACRALKHADAWGPLPEVLA